MVSRNLNTGWRHGTHQHNTKERHRLSVYGHGYCGGRDRDLRRKDITYKNIFPTKNHDSLYQTNM